MTVKPVPSRSPSIIESLESRTLLAAMSGLGSGLVANYFADENLSHLARTAANAIVDFNWAGAAPVSGLPADHFSIRWTGRVQAQFTENYTFHVRSDAGIRLRVDGQLLIDAWAEGSVAERTGSIALTAGRTYGISLEYRDVTGNAEARLSWSSASTPKAVIPSSQLYPSGGWLNADVGNAAAPGSVASTTAANLSVWARGQDSSHFAYQTFTQDGTLTARIDSPATTPGGAGGLMLRYSLAADAPFAHLCFAPDGTIRFQHRSTTGAPVQSLVSGVLAFYPWYARLVRNGPLISAYVSPVGEDGTWSHVGTAPLPAGATQDTAYFGLAASSGSDSITSAASFAEVAMEPTLQLGAGLKDVWEISYANVFVDMVKQARAFNTIGNRDALASVDSNGWPTQDFEVTLQRSIPNSGHVYNGTYKLSFTGQATIAPSPDTPATVLNKVYDAGTNTTTADVVLNGPDSADPAEPVWYFTLRFSATSRGGGGGAGLTGLRVIRPGYDPVDPPTFTTPILDQLRQFTTVRFMDWTYTNASQQVNWADRPRLTDARQSRPADGKSGFAWGKGVAWEYVVDFVNEIDRDLWINIPHQATDDYVTQLATLIRNRLEPDRALYIEYSNEVWNYAFAAANYNKNLAQAEVAAGGSNLNYDGTSDVNALRFRRYARRAMEIGQIFAGVFGAGSMNTRVRPVLAGQFANPESIYQGLKFLNDNYGAPANYLYAVAGAPYFHMVGDQAAADTSAKVLASLNLGIDYALARLNGFHTYAGDYGLRSMSYEGGPDTYGPANVTAKREANLDPAMRDMVKRYLNAWWNSGGELFAWYVAGATSYYCTCGAWGLTGDMTDQDTPKLQAIGDLLAAEVPAFTGGFAVPGTFNARDFYTDPNYPYPYSVITTPVSGDKYPFLLNAPAAGRYYLTLNMGSQASGTTIDVMINGLTHSVSVPHTGGLTQYADLPAIAVDLAAGPNSLRLTARATYQYNIKSITLSAVNIPATASTWQSAGGGNWADAGNWSGGVPNSASAYANFDDDVSAARTITLASPVVLGTLRLDTPGGITLAGGGSLSVHSQVLVAAGSHTIGVPLHLAANTEIYVAAGSTLTLLGNLSLAAGVTLTQSGPGTLILHGVSASGSAARILAAGGTVRLNADAAQVNLAASGEGRLSFAVSQHPLSLDLADAASASFADGGEGLVLSVPPPALSSAARLDLGRARMIVRASAAARDAAYAALFARLAAARNLGGSAWTGPGITSSIAAGDLRAGVALLANSTGSGLLFSTFAGESVDANCLLLQLSFNGDGDLSGHLNIDDYFRIDTAYAGGNAGAGYRNGDFNYSGGVPDADDYFLIDFAYVAQGTPLGLFSPVAIPPAPVAPVLMPADEEAEEDPIDAPADVLV